MSPVWRLSAAGGVVVLGVLLAAVSLKPHWFFPLPPEPAAGPARGGRPPEGSREAADLRVLRWEPVRGASWYRLVFVEPGSGSFLASLATAEPQAELPPEAAARLAPSGECELVIAAVDPAGEVIAREVRRLGSLGAADPGADES